MAFWTDVFLNKVRQDWLKRIVKIQYYAGGVWYDAMITNKTIEGDTLKITSQTTDSKALVVTSVRLIDTGGDVAGQISESITKLDTQGVITLFDLSSLALASAFPTNKILTDDKGLPSVMVYIPKFKMSDVIDGAGDSTHPAFIVNGVEKNGIYISKYQNVAYNNRAYSLPGEDPKVSITADTARKYCEDKGAGWHMMSAMEWGALALWCKKNGWMPWGNNNYGKDTRETMKKGVWGKAFLSM